MVARTPDEFAAAVADFAFPEYALASSLAGDTEASVARTGMAIVGERHGVRDTPAVVYALARSLAVQAIGFEWSHEEVDETLQAFMRDGCFDFERLWALPASAEFFCGDGRITAGHFALLQRLRAEGSLRQVIAFDRLDTEAPIDWATHVRIREPELAARVLAEWNREHRLILLTGGFHAQLESPDGAPMAAYLERALPGLRPVMLPHHDVAEAVVPGRIGA